MAFTSGIDPTKKTPIFYITLVASIGFAYWSIFFRVDGITPVFNICFAVFFFALAIIIATLEPRNSKTAAFIGTIIFMVGTLLSLANVTVGQASDFVALQTNGKTVMGAIDNAQLVTRYGRAGTVYSYDVTYHFMVDGKSYTGEGIVKSTNDYATYNALKSGQRTILVRYLPSNPSKNKLNASIVCEACSQLR